MNSNKKNYGYYILFLVISVIMLVVCIFGLSAMKISSAPTRQIPHTNKPSATDVCDEINPIHTLPESQLINQTKAQTQPETTEEANNAPHTVEQVVFDTPAEEVIPEKPPFIRTQEQHYGKLDKYALGESARVDDSFFDDAVFIGDSRTQGIQHYGNIKNATYYAHKGLNVITAQRSPFINEYGEDKPLVDALMLHPEYKKIYVSFGINDYYFKESLFREKYALLIDDIMSAISPDAKIYICGVYPVWDGMDKGEAGLNNENMIKFNKIALEIAKERGLNFVDLSEAFVKEDGYRYLSEDESFDGVHLYREGYIKVCEYIRTHT